MKKILSVSIAAYNVEQYLAEVLNSFIEEDVLKKCEVFIVNDGSKDRTAEIAGEYVEKYPDTFILIDKENGGWGSTLNAAIKVATGKYFKQLDGDDLFEIKNLPDYLKKLEEKDTDAVITPYMTFDDASGEEIETIIEAPSLERGKVYNLSDIAEYMNVAMHSCTFKTDILRDNKVYLLEKCFYTDAEFTLKALDNCKTVEFVDLMIYKYRLARAGQSVSLEGLKKHYQEHYKVLMELLRYEQIEMKPENRPFFTQKIKQLVQTQYAIFLGLEPSRQHKEEFQKYDQEIKNMYPNYYQVTGKKIKLLRWSNFSLYSLLVK